MHTSLSLHSSLAMVVLFTSSEGGQDQAKMPTLSSHLSTHEFESNAKATSAIPAWVISRGASQLSHEGCVLKEAVDRHPHELEVKFPQLFSPQKHPVWTQAQPCPSVGSLRASGNQRAFENCLLLPSHTPNSRGNPPQGLRALSWDPLVCFISPQQRDKHQTFQTHVLSALVPWPSQWG